MDARQTFMQVLPEDQLVAPEGHFPFEEVLDRRKNE